MSQTPEEQVRALYEEAETRTAEAMEQLVSSQGFGELLAKMTENVVALTRLGNDVGDLVLRNLRIAGRADINRLARQLNRTEDKLEQILQEVERLRDASPGARENGAKKPPTRRPPAKS